MEYELMYLVGESKKSEMDRINEEINAIITTAGGTLTGDTLSFDRKLAYKIQHNWRGVYVVTRFTVPSKDEREENETPDIVAETTRQINLHKDILRYIITDATNLPALAEFEQTMTKAQTEDKVVLKEKGVKIDGELEKALKI